MRQIGGDPFNMTVAGLRLSRRANAVSELHAEVSRDMWRDVAGASPIVPITNGVHVRTWQDARVHAALGSPEALWTVHQELKRELLAAVAARTGVHLDPDVPTIGFCRRAASYKRSDLIFRDRDHIGPLLADRRIQVVFAGKAHPEDLVGRQIIGNLVAMARQYPRAVVFVPDYDMGFARLVTRGADVWLNNPIRPLEACGTSGMKAALNGVLNLSVLDGWWPEACQHGVNGWAIGDDSSGGTHRDAHDAEALYTTLGDEVLPTYADRPRWIAMMRASIETVTARFSSDRMVRDYFERLYSD
jgi:starch phosphorylase